MDRAHRIGQKKEVQVFRFCIENSIEEKVRPSARHLVVNALAAPGCATALHRHNVAVACPVSL